ncbi:MAG: 4Fe-4S binding protein, partial [Clostridiales bacterium]|nr:4Fe-4S binding protein [Clostridiales bacterium]
MTLADKQLCTGCSACYSICPIHCISMQEDAEGFLYPVIDEGKCTQCKQ